jgi:ribosomal-protein-alanine N-acetyltransferase
MVFAALGAEGATCALTPPNAADRAGLELADLLPGMEIRDYTPADWPHVCRIHDAARAQELALGGVDLRAFRPMVDAAEGDEFFVSTTVVACSEDRVVGFISWNGTYISWLYVEPFAQGRGIGKRLLDYALQHIGPEAWTNMLTGNTPALRLYQVAGMETVWTRDSDCDGFPCRGMRLALPTSRMRDPNARRLTTHNS